MFFNRHSDPMLKINYTAINLDPKVIDVDKKGSLTVYLLPEFDYNRLRAEVLPSIRNNTDSEEDYGPYPLDSLLNISFQQTFPSTTAVSVLDQSQRLHEYRHAIEQHQEIRNQLLNDLSTGESNKENEAPNNSNDQSHTLLQDVQRLRVFEPLREDCQRQMNMRAKQNKKQKVQSRHSQQSSLQNRELRSEGNVLNEIHSQKQQKNRTNEKSKQNIQRPKHSVENQQPPSQESSGKKRKLYDKGMIENELNASKDSQIQRNMYVEGKLVNTVKPMKTQEERPVIPAEAMFPDESKDPDVLSNITTSEEFQLSLKAYIENNGIFGITQQKILDKKLVKNIRKINQMVDRSTRRVFKREPASENPYDFNEPGLSKKQKTRKRNNTTTKKGKQKFVNPDDDFVPNNKAVKNKANISRRNQTTVSRPTATTPLNVSESIPAETEPPILRSSLPRKAKPSVLLDLTSDTELKDNENPMILEKATLPLPEEDIFQDFNITPIESQLPNKQPYEKRIDLAPPSSTMSPGSKVARESAVNVNQIFETRILDDDLFKENTDNRNTFVRRNYKEPLENRLRKTATNLIEQEKLKSMY